MRILFKVYFAFPRQTVVATKSSRPFLWLLRRMAIVGAPQYISHVYLARHARSKVSYSSSSTCSLKRNNALFRHLEIQDEQGLLGFGLPIYQQIGRASCRERVCTYV